MEPRKAEKKALLRVEELEERHAPSALVHLPIEASAAAALSDLPDQSAVQTKFFPGPGALVQPPVPPRPA